MPRGMFKRKPVVEKGAKYNRLTVLRLDHKDTNSNQFWLFKCDCGKEKVINVASVKNGNTKSCGCLLYEERVKYGKRRRTHGMTKTVEYRAWQKMKERCYNKNSISYKYYNGRGRNIVVCDRWLNSFENFYKDMGKRPNKKSIDRIDNSDNYFKENCRWATAKEQAVNRRKRMRYKN